MTRPDLGDSAPVLYGNGFLSIFESQRHASRLVLARQDFGLGTKGTCMIRPYSLSWLCARLDWVVLGQTVLVRFLIDYTSLLLPDQDAPRSCAKSAGG